MKQITATATNKEATPEAQSRLEHVHKMTLLQQKQVVFEIVYHQGKQEKQKKNHLIE